MTRDEARTVLAFLTAAYPRWDLPDESARMWLDLLMGLDFEAGKKVAHGWIESEKWPPTWADVRSRYRVSSDAGIVNARSMALFEEELSELRRLPLDERVNLPPESSAMILARDEAREMVRSIDPVLTDKERAEYRAEIGVMVRRLLKGG